MTWNVAGSDASSDDGCLVFGRASRRRCAWFYQPPCTCRRWSARRRSRPSAPPSPRPVRPIVRTSQAIRTPSATISKSISDLLEQQRVAERDQFARALGRLDARDARHGQHVAFGDAVGLRSARASRVAGKSGRWRPPPATARAWPKHRPCAREPSAAMWVRPRRAASVSCLACIGGLNAAQPPIATILRFGW